MNYVLILVIIGIVVFIFDICTCNKHKKFEESFENLTGDIYDEAAYNTVYFGEQIDKDAYDYYRLGTTYLTNIDNPDKALEHYENAIDAIGVGNFNAADFDHVLDRIGDYKEHLEEKFDIPVLENFETVRQTVNNTVTNSVKKTRAPDSIEKKQEWHSDSQNVHDSNVYNELIDQYMIMQNDNLDDKRRETYEEFLLWVRPRLGNNEQQVLDMMNNNGVVPTLRIRDINVREKEYIQEIWRRIHHTSNTKNRDELKNALLEQVKSCYENGSVVCPDGRNTRVLSSLAKLDFNPKIGILKTKEIIRNELLHKLSESAKKITSDLNEDELKEYNAGEESEKIKKLIESIKKDMNNIGDEYRGKLADDQIDRLIMESQSVL